jgi:hypothetical protein
VVQRDFDDPARADDVGGPDNTLGPTEATDSDELRNRDGDEVVDAPDHWYDADDHQTLAQKLAAEEPDQPPPARRSAGAEDYAPPDVYRDAHGCRGQIDGTPEDGDSLFPIIDGPA